MEQYFSKITADHWNFKNKAEKEAQEFAKEMDSILISADRLLTFKTNFIAGIERINKKNPRCRPLHLSIWEMDRRILYGTISISIEGCFAMSVYKIRRNYDLQ